MKIALLAWVGLGVVPMAWYWIEASRLSRRRSWWERILELLGPALWPLFAFTAWIWWRGRRRRVSDFQASGLPHCRRHGGMLLKCQHAHAAFCPSCSTKGCSDCHEDAWASPRVVSFGPGVWTIEYQQIYATSPEGGRDHETARVPDRR